jgi:hypothetical protein
MLITSQKEDLRKRAKEIIVQYQNNLKKFNLIYKKSDNEQQQSLCKNTKIKTFSNLILSDDNNGDINVNNEEDQNLKASIKTEDEIKQVHKNDLRNNNSKRKMSYNISTRSDETINHKEKRRTSIVRAAEHGAQGKRMANVEIPSLRCVDGLSAPHRRIDVVKNLFVGEASRLPFIIHYSLFTIHHSFNTKTGLYAFGVQPFIRTPRVGAAVVSS